MKRFAWKNLILFSLFMLCLLILPSHADAEQDSGYCGGEGDGTNLTWTFDHETGVLSIEGKGKMADYYTQNDTPWCAFGKYMKTLRITNGPTSIGGNAFYGCSSFSGSLTIPDSVTSINYSAFKGCSGFTGSLDIPNSVTKIGDRAFSGCSGFSGSLTIPDSVTRIDSFAFYGCSGFTGSLDIPDSVTSIGMYAFTDCSGFTGSLDIPDSVTSIGSFAFERCSGFSGSLTIPDSITTIDQGVFCYCSGFSGSLTIPDSVTSIGEHAFSDCSGFTGSLTIPASVVRIEDEAFYDCDKIKEVCFLGNAPAKLLGSYCFNSDVILYYNVGTTGWTTPTYKGYKCYPINSSGGVVKTGQASQSTYKTYQFQLVDYDTGKPVTGASLTYDGKTVPADAKGIVKITNMQDEKELTVIAPNYNTVWVSNYPAKEAGRDIIKMNRFTCAVTSAVMKYNKDQKDLVAQRAVINTIYKNTKFTISCSVDEKDADSVAGYVLRQEDTQIAASETGAFSLTVGKFKENKAVYVDTLDEKGKVLASTLLALTVKREEEKIPATLELGEKLVFTIPSSVPFIGGNKATLDFPLLPISVDYTEDSIELGFNYDIADYKRTLTAGRKPKVNWFKNPPKGDLAGWMKKMEEELGAEKNKRSVFKDLSFTWSFIGGAEMPYGADRIEGNLYFLLEVEYSKGTQVWFLPPVVVIVSIKGNASAGWEFEYSIAEGFSDSFPITVGAEVKATGGLGWRKFNVGGYGRGKMELEFKLFDDEAGNCLESWMIEGALGVSATNGRKTIFDIELLKGEYYIYRRDTGALAEGAVPQYLSPGAMYAGLDSDLIYETVERIEQSKWLGASPLKAETVVVEPDFVSIPDPVPSALPEETPFPAETPASSPEATPDPAPEATPSAAPAPMPEDTPAPTPSPEPEVNVPSPTPVPTETPAVTPAESAEPSPEAEPTPSTEDNQPEADMTLAATGGTHAVQLGLSRNTLVGRRYLSSPALLTTLPSSVTALQESCDTEIAPLLLPCGDTLMMLYCDADPDRPVEDCSILVASVLDPVSGAWTKPTPVWDDGTADYSPDAYASENGVYIVWENATSSIQETDTLNEIGEKMELAVAFFEQDTCTFTVETITSDNSVYESMANIAVGSNGDPAVIWAENATGDFFGLSGTQEDPNKLYLMKKTDSGWGEKVLLADYTGLALSADLAFTDSCFEACINLDEDLNFDTVEDSIILTATENAVSERLSGTSAQYLDGNLLYLDITDAEKAAFYCNGTAEEMPVLPEVGFSSAVDANGNITLYWNESGSNAGHLCLMVYDATADKWSEKITLVESAETHYCERPACAYVGGQQVFVYIDRCVEDLSNMTGTTGLYWLAPAEQTALSIKNVLFDHTAIVPGESLTLTVAITNEGTQDIASLPVVLKNADGLTVFDDTIHFDLVPGATGSADVTFTLPAQAVQSDYTLCVGSEEYAGIDIGASLLMTGNQVYKINNEQHVLAYVKNFGLEPTSGTLSVIDQSNGAVVASGSYSDLAYGDSYSLQFSVSKLKEDWNLTIVAEPTDEQVDDTVSYLKLYFEAVPGDADLDGAVTTLDALYVSKYLSGLVSLSENEKLAADISGDGNVTMEDVIMITSVVS